MKMGGSLYLHRWNYCRLCSVARIRGLENLSSFDLGLTPQASCLRLLRSLKEAL